MPSRSRIIVALTLILIMSANASAFAGFQIKQNQFSADTGVAGAKQVDAVEKELITSVINSETAGVTGDDLKPAGDSDFVAKDPVTSDESPSPAAPVENSNIVTGFGKDLPLVISLQQIVPAKYKIVLDETIDGKLLTSWEGGADWEQVLMRMLKKHNFSYTVNDAVLSIKNNAPKIENISRTAKEDDFRMPEPSMKSAKAQVKQQNIAKNAKGGKKAVIKPSKNAKNDAKGEDFKNLYDASTRQSRLEQIAKDDGDNPLNILQPLPKEVVVRPAPEFEFSPDAKIQPNWRMANARWVAHKDQSLKEVLAEWSRQEGVELYWAIDYDYRINRDIAMGGEYANAVARLINVFRDIRPQPYGQLHKGTRGPLVLVVNSYDLSH